MAAKKKIKTFSNLEIGDLIPGRLIRVETPGDAGVLARLIRAVCAEYSTDPTQPSVILSYLTPSSIVSGTTYKPGFYASVVRYREKFGRDKVVVTQTSGHATPHAAAVELSKLWLGEKNLDAKQALRDCLRNLSS